MKQERITQLKQEEQEEWLSTDGLSEDEQDVLDYDDARASDDGMRISLESVRADMAGHSNKEKS